ncbi:neutrophil gelatinase-associated lipocalin-like [Cavia porcellus]|uniref:neutrophil gelatinase-associated lipocalin-like n=1 Tax=Cavia porcellus TaxID=10141 RepID=UPI000661DB09|nr:neutrophil gelatinase-associated lipocalin-like [Cavia porcellus]
MAVGLLLLGFILLGTLKTQAQDFWPTWLPSLHLRKVPVQPDFQADQFQGKWYTIATTDSRIQNGSEKQINMSSIIYKLEHDHSFISSSFLLRDQVCEQFIRTFVPSIRHGQFKLANMKRYHGVQSYTMTVAATNYNEFAVVYINQMVRSRVDFRMDLYGRSKELSPTVNEDFVILAKYLGLMDDNIVFTTPLGNDELSRRREAVGLL